mgnify:CR=1 FL=1
MKISSITGSGSPGVRCLVGFAFLSDGRWHLRVPAARPRVELHKHQRYHTKLPAHHHVPDRLVTILVAKGRVADSQVRIHPALTYQDAETVGE